MNIRSVSDVIGALQSDAELSRADREALAGFMLADLAERAHRWDLDLRRLRKIGKRQGIDVDAIDPAEAAAIAAEIIAEEVAAASKLN